MRFFRWPSSAKRPVGTDALGDVLGSRPISRGRMEQRMHSVLGPRRTFLAITALLLSFVTGAHAQQGGMTPALVYDAQTRGPVPIPSSERGLQTVVAEPWFKVSDEGLVLEGPAFDRECGRAADRFRPWRDHQLVPQIENVASAAFEEFGAV